MRGEVDKKAKDGLKEEEEVWRNTGRPITEQGEGHSHTHTHTHRVKHVHVLFSGHHPFLSFFFFQVNVCMELNANTTMLACSQ